MCLLIAVLNVKIFYLYDMSWTCPSNVKDFLPNSTNFRCLNGVFAKLSDLIQYSPLSRLQLKLVVTVCPWQQTTEELRAIRSHHRNDPWKKEVENLIKLGLCLQFPLLHFKDSLLFLFPDEPDAKKVASQSERDSAMCTLNNSVVTITPFCSISTCSPVLNLLQLLELS